MARSSKVKVGAVEVSAVLEGPRTATDLLFFAPGAGANIYSDFMSFVTDGLASAGLKVCRFNFPYLEAGRKTPDRQPVLEETYRKVVETKTKGWDGRVFVGGKSMGGRIASHAVSAGLAADGLVFMGYPLHPPGRPERVRDEHLYDIKMPMLFVEGTRDPFCPLNTLAAVNAKIDALTEVAVIDDGDHSFKVRKSSGRTTPDAWTEVAETIANWIGKVPKN